MVIAVRAHCNPLDRFSDIFVSDTNAFKYVCILHTEGLHQYGWKRFVNKCRKLTEKLHSTQKLRYDVQLQTQIIYINIIRNILAKATSYAIHGE